MFREVIIMLGMLSTFVRVCNKLNKSHMVDVDLLDMHTTHRK